MCNTQERFLALYIDENGFRKDKIGVENISKTSLYRKLSCDFLKKTDVLEFSILSLVQKNDRQRNINLKISINND